MDRVDRQIVAAGNLDRLLEAVRVDPELRRAVAAVRQPGVVAGTRTRD